MENYAHYEIKLSITKNFPLNTLWKSFHNVFAILGRVRQALRHGGHPELVDEVTAAVTSSHSYEEALARIMEYVEVE